MAQSFSVILQQFDCFQSNLVQQINNALIDLLNTIRTKTYKMLSSRLNHRRSTLIFLQLPNRQFESFLFQPTLIEDCETAFHLMWFDDLCIELVRVTAEFWVCASRGDGPVRMTRQWDPRTKWLIICNKHTKFEISCQESWSVSLLVL